MTYTQKDKDFREAARNNHIAAMKYLVGSTPDPEEREQMIHTTNDLAFKDAAAGGHVEAMQYLVELTPDSKKREQMIHTMDNLAFRKAAAYGHVKAMQYLVELTLDPEEREKMIHVANDLAFTNAAAGGHVDAMQYLVELTLDPEEREKMIHSADDVAFTNAAAGGHVEAMKYLIKLTPNPEEREQMIHATDDLAFTNAAAGGYVEAMKYLSMLRSFYGYSVKNDIIQYKSELKPYLDINIMALKNLTLVCKDLFSEEQSFILNVDIWNIICQFVANCTPDKQKNVVAAMKAFAKNKGGFKGFIKNYESELEKEEEALLIRREAVKKLKETTIGELLFSAENRGTLNEDITTGELFFDMVGDCQKYEEAIAG